MLRSSVTPRMKNDRRSLFPSVIRRPGTPKVSMMLIEGQRTTLRIFPPLQDESRDRGVYSNTMKFSTKLFIKAAFFLTATASSMSLSSQTIAVIGGGGVGSTLANSLVQSKMAGKVVIGARDPSKTKAALAEKDLGHLIVESMPDAIAAADILILAVPGAQTDEGIEAVAQSLKVGDGNNLQGKTIIDATNPLSEFPGLEVRWKQGTSAGEVFQKCLPDCKVYKCFNTIGVEWMDRQKALEGGMDMLFCGPDSDISELVSAVGFTPRYVGPIRYARNLEAMAELWIHCAIPPLPARQLGRDWGFALKGNPEP